MINLCEHCWPHLEHAETKRYRARVLLQFCYRLFRAIVFPLLLSVAFSQTKQSLSSTKRNAGSNSSFPFSSPSFNVACEEDMPKDGIVITQHFQNRLTPCMSFFFLFFLFFFSPILRTLVTSAPPYQPPLTLYFFYFLTKCLQRKRSWVIAQYFPHFT